MTIGGIQKLSLLDFPDHTCCTLFTQGCNFRCPFCHNTPLIKNVGEQAFPFSEILDFLKSRKGLLDGVCISGGEPLSQRGLEDFIVQIKKLGFLVKLDTNGSFPEKLQSLAEKKLIDYVAMDIKNAPEKYAATAGVCDIDIEPIKESAAFLMQDTVPYEFRTTVVKELHTESDIESVGRWLHGANRYFLQSFVASENVLCPGMTACSPAEMQRFLEIVKIYIPGAELRGI